MPNNNSNKKCKCTNIHFLRMHITFLGCTIKAEQEQKEMK